LSDASGKESCDQCAMYKKVS